LKPSSAEQALQPLTRNFNHDELEGLSARAQQKRAKILIILKQKHFEIMKLLQDPDT